MQAEKWDKPLMRAKDIALLILAVGSIGGAFVWMVRKADAPLFLENKLQAVERRVDTHELKLQEHSTEIAVNEARATERHNAVMAALGVINKKLDRLPR